MSSTNTNALKILSLNTAFPLFTNWPLFSTKKARAKAILQHIAEIKDTVDVVCLQEVFAVPIVDVLSFRSVGSFDNYFKDGLRRMGFGHVVVSPSSGSFYKQNSGLLIASKFNISESAHVYYGTQDEPTTNKGALRATLQVPVQNKSGASIAEVIVVTTHLSSSPKSEPRTEQLTHLDSWLSTSGVPAKHPIIIAGDFNQAEFGDVWPGASPFKWKNTYLGLPEELEPTFPEEEAVLDYFFYSNSSFIELLPVETTLADDNKKAVDVLHWNYNSSAGSAPVSDHHAISAFFKLLSSPER